MSRKTLEIEVNHEILVWARESVGLSIEKVAQRIRKDTKKIEHLESGVKKPTISTLRELAKYYKRPLGVFFLPVPPKEPSPPTDFRVLPGTETKPFTKKTLLAIREARWRSKKALELLESLGYDPKTRKKTANASEDPEEVSYRERKILDITIGEQLSWDDIVKAYLEWRNKLSKRNILTFQIPIPLEEARGFSLFEEGLPAIVVSSEDALGARIFTLFHEYAHLMLGAEGICFPSEHKEVKGRTEHSRIERFCNQFAGAFLVPKEELIDDKDVASMVSSRNLPDEILRKISNKYKVSRYVILRRLLISNLISEVDYKRKISNWEKAMKAEKDKKPYGPEPAKRSLWKYGSFFTSLVFESRDRGIITTSDALDYLSIKLKHLNKLETLLTRGK